MEIQNGINAFNGALLNGLQKRPQEQQYFAPRNNSAAATEGSEPDTELSSVLSSYLTY